MTIEYETEVTIEKDVCVEFEFDDIADQIDAYEVVQHYGTDLLDEFDADDLADAITNKEDHDELAVRCWECEGMAKALLSSDSRPADIGRKMVTGWSDLDEVERHHLIANMDRDVMFKDIPVGILLREVLDKVSAATQVEVLIQCLSSAIKEQVAQVAMTAREEALKEAEAAAEKAARPNNLSHVIDPC